MCVSLSDITGPWAHDVDRLAQRVLGATFALSDGLSYPILAKSSLLRFCVYDDKADRDTFPISPYSVKLVRVVN